MLTRPGNGGEEDLDPGLPHGLDRLEQRVEERPLLVGQRCAEIGPERLLARRPRPWYVCLGRTRRAFATHPYVQRTTERATNRAASLALGRRLDATAGACWLTRDTRANSR